MACGIDGLPAELLAQRDFLAAREPAYARVLELLHAAIQDELGARLAGIWATRDFNSTYERPLLLLAALRYDALCDAGAHPLHAALAETPAHAEAATQAALASATAPERTRFWHAVRERAVQTNETTRAVTWLWPAHLLARAGERRALHLVDLGTSAGLNLIADALPALWRDQYDAPIPIAPRLNIAARIGLDLAPLDVRDEDSARWLRACVWPSDVVRLQRLEQGIACFRESAAGTGHPRLIACALDDAPLQLDALPDDALILCVQSIVRDYLPPDARVRHEHGMRAFLQRRPPRSAFWAELEMQPAGAASIEDAAAISLHFVDARGAMQQRVLARCHPHPKLLQVDTAAVAAFEAELIER